MQLATHAAASPSYPVLRFFHATTIAEATPWAQAILARVSCPRCRHVLQQRFDRLGSQLFYDDDPRELIFAFDPDDRDPCTLRLLAACVVLYGRAREPALAH